jgi:hypothetical protein
MNKLTIKYGSLIIGSVLIATAAAIVLFDPSWVPFQVKPWLQKFVTSKAAPKFFPYYVYALFFCTSILGFSSAFGQPNSKVFNNVEWFAYAVLKAGLGVVAVLAITTIYTYVTSGFERALVGLGLASLTMLFVFGPAWVAEQFISLLNGDGVKNFSNHQLKNLNIGLSCLLLVLSIYGAVGEFFYVS